MELAGRGSNDCTLQFQGKQTPIARTSTVSKQASRRVRQQQQPAFSELHLHLEPLLLSVAARGGMYSKSASLAEVKPCSVLLIRLDVVLDRHSLPA